MYGSDFQSTGSRPSASGSIKTVIIHEFLVVKMGFPVDRIGMGSVSLDKSCVFHNAHECAGSDFRSTGSRPSAAGSLKTTTLDEFPVFRTLEN